MCMCALCLRTHIAILSARRGCEQLPYDVNASYGEAGFVGYRVLPNVTEHDAFGVGVYHYFRDFHVHPPTAIAAPANLEGRFVAPLATYLSGLGTVDHVINDKGNKTGAVFGLSLIHI